MQRLGTTVMRIGGPDVQAAEFEIGAENYFNCFEHLRSFDHGFEDLTFINGVGDAPGSWLGLEFAACPVTFEDE